MNKTLRNIGIAAAAIATCTFCTKANSMPAYNEPTTGTTTLEWKCKELLAAQNRNDLGRMAQMSFQIGSQHDVPWFSSVDDDCASVGIFTSIN